MKALKVFARIFKGLYDILATYLLAWVLFFAALAFGFHWLLELAASGAGYDSTAPIWRKLAGWTSESAVVWIRFGAFALLHAGVIYALRKPLAGLQSVLERGFDIAISFFKRISRDSPKLRVVGHLVFSLTITLLLVPFVLQPTLGPTYTPPHSWVERAANLADGTASRFVADSVIGLYRKLYAKPVDPTGGVTEADVDATHASFEPEPDKATPTAPPAPSGNEPLMDRWDPQIERACNGDPRKFAMVKAFMWVESAGRQFAVSPTGCSGLMQFCAGTARSRPFRRVFGTGQVYTCKCEGRCRIDRATRRALETGVGGFGELRDDFPCDLTDARFKPQRSIRAGALYIDRLDSAC